MAPTISRGAAPRKLRVRHGVLYGALLCAGLAQPAGAQTPGLTWLSDPVGLPGPRAYGMSPDGRIVVGTTIGHPVAAAAWVDGVYNYLPSPDPINSHGSVAYAASANGVVVGEVSERHFKLSRGLTVCHEYWTQTTVLPEASRRMAAWWLALPHFPCLPSRPRAGSGPVQPPWVFYLVTPPASPRVFPAMGR